MFGEEFDVIREFGLDSTSDARDGLVSFVVVYVRVTGDSFTFRISDECPRFRHVGRMVVRALNTQVPNIR